MFLATKVIVFLVFFIISFNSGWSDRTKDKMYQTIDASKACFRRLNATHQIGCTSDRGGSTGVIHFCRDQKDLDYILRNGTASPYVPIIPTDLFTNDNIKLLMKRNKKVSGLIVYAQEDKKVNHFTHDNQCPNPLSSLPNTCGGKNPIWNPYGTGLLYQDIPFPIFYIENEVNLSEAKKCFEKHNNHSFDTQRDRALCSLELSTFMYATTNTPTCIRRSNAITNLNPVKFCDPLGDQNVWASLFPLASNNFTEPIQTKYIFVVARLDTTSMFEKTAGAVSPITGIVTLLTTAKLLKEMLPASSFNTIKKNIIFILFNGESYDYIGSQRFVYEMIKGNFPVKSTQNFVLPQIKIDDIDLIVELSQLNLDKNVFVHTVNDPTDFIGKLQKYSNGFDVNSSALLPPASIHTFMKNRTDIPGCILTDHNESYKNPYYNSIYDNASNLNYKYDNSSGNDPNNIQTKIVKLSEMIAKSLYEEAVGIDYKNNQKANYQFVNELFYCYLEDANCKVHQAVQKIRLQKQTLSLYVGVEVVSNFITTFVGLTLGWVTGDIVGEANINCTNEPKNYVVKYYNMSVSIDDLNTTKCYQISMNFTEAVSPAFIIEDYDWNSGEYSTWAESTWGDIRLRLFLKPSAAHENMTIAIGSIVFILSSLFVYFIKSKSNVLFTIPQSSISTIQPANC